MLLHRTYDPAIQVFHQAAERYPSSPRLWIGLGMAQYSQGKYEDATKSLLKAADLDPTDARCYLFLSRAYLSSPNQAEDVIRRFHTYAQMQPGNALAQYYYAMGLWKGRRTETDAPDFTTIAMLLNKAIALDGKIADAHLQLGILYATQHDYQKAYPEYTRALELDPKLADVHFRLGQYYARTGDKERGQQEFETYRKLHAQYLAKVEKERAEVQQFVYSAQNTSARQP